jgi:hypothetical protein
MKPRENFCRICLKAAANNTFNSNFGRDPDPSTQLCPTHLGEWQDSPEFKAKMKQGGGTFHLPDFCNRIVKEEAVIKERLKNEAMKTIITIRDATWKAARERLEQRLGYVAGASTVEVKDSWVIDELHEEAIGVKR